MKQRFVIALMVVLIGCGGVQPLSADDAYPTKPLTAYVGYRAGGGTDTIGRVLAKHIGDALGQQINVVNKDGAGGGIAATIVMNAAPDGYSILLSSMNSVTAGPLLNRSLTYSVADFEPVALIAAYQSGIVAPVDKPFKTMKEYIAYAREHAPTKYVTVTNLSRLLMQHIVDAEKIDVTFVPAKGGSEVLNMFAANQVDLAYSGGFHQAYTDRMRLLAAATLKRHPANPDVPTLLELGYDVAIDAHIGILAPKGTPANIIAKLNSAIQKAIEVSDVKSILEKYQYPLDYQGPDEAKRTLAEQSGFYKKLIGDNKITE